MERITNILNHDLFCYHLARNEEAEKDRIFCRHDLAHFFDVARIGTLMDLEDESGIGKELIYAAALLHDLGKHMQYEDKIPHELAGAPIAAAILKDSGFDEDEIKIITEAILSHRNSSVQKEHTLSGILYRADKASRTCFHCPARKECDWDEEKKNHILRY